MLHEFRCRYLFAQYTPSKPSRSGIKIYAICDIKTCYTYIFEIYCGKQPTEPYLKSNKIEDIKKLAAPIEKSNSNMTKPESRL